MKHLFFPFYISVLMLISFLFFSCGSKRDIVYFQNSEWISSEQFKKNAIEYSAKIMPNDNLFITVTAVNQGAVEAFNIAPLNRGSLNTASLDIFGYLVDQNGNINLPYVGEIHVAGLNKTEATHFIQQKISQYVENPVVNIRFLNYKVSIIGEVNRPGVYTVTDERISIPQAIALAGDLTIYGQRRNVQLIRMEKGEEKIYFIDLTSPDIFLSPNYYLHQNDVIYVSPNKTKAGSSTYNQNLPLLVSLISVAITAIALFVRYK